MTPEVFIQLAQDAHKCLHKHHLHDALYLIDYLLKEVQLSDALDAFQRLEQDYQSMLRLFVEIEKDEKGEDIKLQMEREAFHLLCSAERAYRLQHRGEELYVSTYKELEEKGESLQSITQQMAVSLSPSQQREELLDRLFYAVWTCKIWDREEREFVEQQTFPILSNTEKCVFVSALTMALMEYLDYEKYFLLLKIAAQEKGDLQVRAFVGEVLLCIVNPEDFKIMKDRQDDVLVAQLSTEYFSSKMPIVNQCFLICQQAKSARERMENDILPNLQKIAKNGKVDLRMTEEGDFDVDIPAENDSQRQELMGKVREFLDMHRDGVDLNASAMMMVRNLPFFKQLPHWFLPYDTTRSEIAALEQRGDDMTARLLNNLYDMAGNGECDIDRYTTSIMLIQHMDKGLKDSLSAAASALQEQLPDDMPPFTVKTIDQTGNPEDFQKMCSKYMKVMYRIFTSWPTCKEWRNPFDQSTNWLENSNLKIALEHNREGLHYLADYLLKYKNYQEADNYLNQLVKLEGSDAETLRSAAFCKQQQGHYGGALTLYNQADLLEPNHLWTLNQMEQCYAHLERHEQRLDCLLQLEKLDADNVKVITDTGLCLMQLHRWQEASQRFYRLEFEDKRVIPSQRAIAWCALQQGKTEQALKYYQKVLDTSSARWQDYLNAGHAAWVMKDTQKALSLYRGYIKRYLTDDPKITDALTPFNEDNDLLLSLGKQQYEIDLMHDVLEEE